MYKFTPDKTTITPRVQMEEDNGSQSASSPAKVNQQVSNRAKNRRVCSAKGFAMSQE